MRWGSVLGALLLGALFVGSARAEPEEQPQSAEIQTLEAGVTVPDDPTGYKPSETANGDPELTEIQTEVTDARDLIPKPEDQTGIPDRQLQPPRKHPPKPEEDTPESRTYEGRRTADKEHTEKPPDDLTATEKARIRNTRPATGGTVAQRARELQIARTDIVAEPVEPISKKRYKQLYKASAKEYGFARDWYILAAVGKLESNHGENMGPSSAGALGPMQFLPSTWSVAGVDGNEDGVANIMDPEDAIPAAAKYLKEGGAPQDWKAALFTYNHAGWYVEKVLGVAEGYRSLVEDDRVGPYT